MRISDWSSDVCSSDLIAGPTELTFNAHVAANLSAPVLLVVSGFERTPPEIEQLAEMGIAEIAQSHATTTGVLANRCEPDQLDDVCEQLARLELPSWARPETDRKSGVGGRRVSGRVDP